MNPLPDSCDSKAGKGRGQRAATVLPRRSLFLSIGWSMEGRALMSRIRTLSLGLTVSFLAVTAASAQMGTLPLPSDAFRKAQVQQQAPLPQTQPAKRPVASFWTSSEPTFDEG